MAKRPTTKGATTKKAPANKTARKPKEVVDVKAREALIALGDLVISQMGVMPAHERGRAMAFIDKAREIAKELKE